MKITLAATILVMALGVVAFTQAVPFQKLKGPVAKVEKWNYKVEEKFGKPVEIWDAHRVTKYNADDKPIEIIDYTKAGEIQKRRVRTFDSSGRLIQVEDYNWGTLEGKAVYRYEGNVQIERSYDATGNLKSATDTELDKKGNAVRTTIYDTGSGKTSTIIEFDTNGNITRMTAYDVSSGDISSVWENTYTSDGRPLSTKVYNDKGELLIKQDYSYGVEGMDVVSTFIIYLLGAEFKRSKSGIVITKMDKYGNWTEKRSYESKELFGKTEWILTSIYRREITYR